MSKSACSYHRPGFGKCLAVFLTVFALLFAPCLPAVPLAGVGVKPAAADVPADMVINSTTNTTVSTRDGNITVVSGGSLSVHGINSEVGSAACIMGAGNFAVVGNGTVNLTGNNASSSGGGGAIYVERGNVILSGSGTNTFTGNTASTGSGGAIFAYQGVALSGGTNIFENNTADYGGAIFALNGKVDISGTNTFENNTASSDGGAIYATNGSVTLSNGTNTFTGNTATTNGGAIYADGDVTLSESSKNTFENNTANRGNGGAIYARDNVAISGGTNTFENNTANGNGGAIYASGNVTLTGTNTFTGNNATSGGGAIYTSSGNVTITGTAKFEGNTAANASAGGAIYASGNIYLTPTANNSIDFMTATDTLATENPSSWVHIGGVGDVNFLEGFNNPGITTVHFGANNYTAYNASAGWASNTMPVTKKPVADLITTGWAATAGSGRANQYSDITGNFVLGDNQTLSLDMNVANSTSGRILQSRTAMSPQAIIPACMG